MIDSNDEVSRAIQDRRLQINNNDATCILEAEQNLHASFEEAGNGLTEVSREWYDELSIFDDDYVTPLLDEMEILKALIEIEIFNILGTYNSVDEMEYFVSMLALEAAIYSALFEFFVSEIYTDFVVFELITNRKNAVIFPLLDEEVNKFRQTGNLIRNSLANCNE